MPASRKAIPFLLALGCPGLAWAGGTVVMTPLIVLIVIFAVSVLGLTVIPGQDAAGRPVRMGFFDAFYIMSYTASTIGFGEIPYPFTYNQRMWVTISIYLTVIGWAYAIGSLLALLQDRAFRSALAEDGPVLVDVHVTKEENCYPMIPAGQAARDMVG